MDLKQLLAASSFRIALILLAVLSVICTQIPLFNYLGFEFSALLALFLSLIAGLITISLWKRGGGRHEGRIVSFILDSGKTIGLLVIIPFAVISANAYSVKNCSFLHGTILFLLIVLPAVVLTQALATTIIMVFRKWRRTWFVAIWILTLLQIVYVTFTEPQIFAFNPVLGFFPGFTYDESLQIIDRLLLYRIGTIAASALLFLLAIAIDRHRSRQPSEFKPLPLNTREIGATLVLLVIVVVLYLFSNRLGFSSSQSFIESELGGRVETDHFVISYPDTLLKGRRLSHIIQLHEFTLNRLSEILRVTPRRKIHTFLYASAEQKGRLVGAAHTNIAKPWLWQLHLNVSDVDGSFLHELTHVVAAEFGFPLLRIGTNSGLIEGLATSVERARYGEHLHRLAAMVFAIGLEPDLESLFSFSGFIRAQADVSYTLAGSFCRYLIDRYGLRRFKILYRTGNMVALYNKDLPMLLREWRTYVEQYKLREGEYEKAAYLFKRPSIFAKECARVIANINTETRALFSQKRYDEALGSSSRSLQHTTSIEAITQKVNALFRLKRYQEAIDFGREKLQDSTVRHSLVMLRLVLGDALWAVDSIRAAKSSYEALERVHISPPVDEAAAIRLEALNSARLSQGLKLYFTEELPDTMRQHLLRKLIQTEPANPLPRYLLAREFAVDEEYSKAVSEFATIRRMNADVLEMMRHRRMAQAQVELGRYQRAQIHYWQSLNYVHDDVQALPIEERLRFCEWMENYLRSLD